jgi:hypothetical protein
MTSGRSPGEAETKGNSVSKAHAVAVAVPGIPLKFVKSML